MPHAADGLSVPAPEDHEQLESALKSLWERTRRAGELVVQLRQEKAALEGRAGDLEQVAARLRQELAKQEEIVRTLTEAAKVRDASGGGMFANGEREALSAKVKELLAKIDSYL